MKTKGTKFAGRVVTGITILTSVIFAQTATPQRAAGGYLSWIVLVLVITAVFFYVRARSPYRRSSGGKRNELIADLDRRYRKGEITRAEYDRRKASVR